MDFPPVQGESGNVCSGSGLERWWVVRVSLQGLTLRLVNLGVQIKLRQEGREERQSFNRDKKTNFVWLILSFICETHVLI